MAAYRIREVFRGGALTLSVLESKEMDVSQSDFGVQVSGSLEPLVLVVSDGRGRYALDMAARRMDLDQIRQRIPELEALLSRTD